jgi:hypothetical protein
MQEAGFPAIRIAAAIEDYDHQHQNVRVENGTSYGDTVDEMDFAYLARATRLNIAILSALARAPMPPTVTITGAVTPDTVLAWRPVAGALDYRIYRRRTDTPDWGAVYTGPASNMPGFDEMIRVTMPGVRIDDWVFGISSVAADGSESAIASAVPGGAYAPLPRPVQP